MRRFIALMLVLCMLVSTASAADSLKALSMEEQRIYLSNALSIQTSEHTYTTGGIYDWGWGWLDTYSSSSTSREWYPYRRCSHLSSSPIMTPCSSAFSEAGRSLPASASPFLPYRSATTSRSPSPWASRIAITRGFLSHSESSSFRPSRFAAIVIV